MTRGIGVAVAIVLVCLRAAAVAGQEAPCAEFQVNTHTTFTQQRPAVASAPNGDFVVVWEGYQQEGSGGAIVGRRYDASGSPRGGEFIVSNISVGVLKNPAVAMDASGRFVVVWRGPNDSPFTGIFGRRYDAAGTAEGPAFQVNTYITISQTYPAVAADETGNFVVVWQSHDQDGDEDGIFGQRYDSTGARQGTEFQVNVHTTGDQVSPAVSLHPLGFVVVWTGQGGNGSGAA
ncbi:MAG TPA: RTX toxin, partial [Vicinamibacteria bacterium]